MRPCRPFLAFPISLCEEGPIVGPLSGSRTPLVREVLRYLPCMKTLQIAALAVVMGPMFSLWAQSEAPVEVISHTLRQSSTGSLYVVGEVRNTYKEPLCFVQIDITYLDDKGNPVGVDRFTAKDAGTMAMDQVMADRDVIPPGETSSFSRVRDMSKIKGTVASCKVTAKGMRLRDGAMGATTSNVQVAKEGQSFHRVRGTFTATGKARCKNPRAIAVGYDKSGQAQVVSGSYLRDNSGKDINQLEPGQSASFNFLLNDDTGKVETVKVFTSCECE